MRLAIFGVKVCEQKVCPSVTDKHTKSNEIVRKSEISAQNYKTFFNIQASSA